MKSAIHVQHVLLSLQPGGLENGVVNLVNRLDERDFHSSICCLKQAGEFAARLPRDRVAIKEMGWRGGNNLWLPFRLARHFRRTQTDIVHTRNAEAFYYGFLGAKLAGVPAVVHSEHGRSFTDRQLRFMVQRTFSRYTEAIFAVSQQLRTDLVTHIGIPVDRIQVLYNGVDLDRFGSLHRDPIRQQLGIDNDTIVIGSVGRLVAVKNYALLLRAIHRLGDSRLILMLVGDGPEREALESLAQGLGIKGRVRFLGHRDDVPGLLGAMDIFVLPSLSEGMSNTMLEAMASQVATVASNVGGAAEIIRDSSNGMLFESNNLDELCCRLGSLLEDDALRNRIATEGRRSVLSNFGIDGMVSRYEALYRSVLS
jgi:sugar transferase (PEP-CTERM/EpsH1 system associated)